MDPLASLFERYRRDGDLRALGEVFDALAPRLLTVALHVCGNAADAEDVLQQTFLLAMEREVAFDAGRPLEPWFAGLLTNVARNARRHEERRRAEPLPDLAGDDVAPIAAAERAELVALLRTHVDALPGEQRQVLRLQLQHGLGPAAIAEALELSPGAVRMRLHRGLETLRKMLPASLAALLATSLAPRGLAAIKQSVMAAGAAKAAAVVAASTSAATAGSMLMLGGALAMKKLLALMMLMGVVGVLWCWAGLPPLTHSGEASPAAPAVPAPAAATMPEPTAPNVAAASVREAAPVAASDVAREPGPTELWGLAVDASTRAPVAGAAIELLHRDADEFTNLDLAYGERTTSLARATSDAAGRFRFEVVRARPHRLAVRASGYAPLTVTGSTGGSEVTVELARGATVTGVVRSAGRAAADVGVRISVRGESDDLANGRTDAGGAFHFTDLPAFAVYVKAGSAAFAEQSKELRLAGGQVHQVEIELDPGSTVRGHVVDAATGSPIADAAVADSWTMQRSVRTSLDGAFALPGLHDGRYVMCRVAARGYASASRNLGGKLGEQVQFRLVRGGEVAGRLVDGGGAPIGVAYVAVCASYIEGSGLGGCDWIPAVLGNDGRFAAAGLRPDQHYWLMARASGCGVRVYALPRPLASGERLDVGDVALQSGAGIEGRVVEDSGAPVADQEVTLEGLNADAMSWFDPAGVAKGRVARADVWRIASDRDGPADVLQFRQRRVRTDAKGRFRWAGVAGGSYIIKVRLRGRTRPLETTVEVRDGELHDRVEIVVTAGLAIRGTLVWLNARPSDEPIYLQACLEDEQRSERFTARVDSDGAFHFDGVVDGLYTIALGIGTKGQVLAPQFHVKAGSEGLRFVFEAPSYVGGQVVGADGKPMQASVYAFYDEVKVGASAQTTDAEGRFRIEVPSTFRGKLRAQRGDSLIAGEATGVVAGQTELRIEMGKGLFRGR